MNKITFSVILCSCVLACVSCGSDDSSKSSSDGNSPLNLKLAERITQQYSGNIESIRAEK